MSAHLRETFKGKGDQVRRPTLAKPGAFSRHLQRANPTAPVLARLRLESQLTPLLRALQNSPAFVTFLTAGFPSIDATVPLMLAMEAGGADVIELGVPFTDPLADGKAIQDANNIAIEQNVDYTMCLKFVSDARKQGLKTPVILMG